MIKIYRKLLKIVEIHKKVVKNLIRSSKYVKSHRFDK